MGAGMKSRLLPAAVLLVLGFFSVQILKPYLQGWRYEQLVQREVDSARPRTEAGAMHQRLLTEGRAMGLIVNAEDIQVERLVGGYQVRIRYAVPADFKVYRTAIDFDFTTRNSGSQLSE